MIEQIASERMSPLVNPSIKEIREQLTKLFLSLSRNTIVGISGRGGSGKSTLTDRLESSLREHGSPVVIFHIDDFVFPTVVRDANSDPGKARYFESYDFETLFNGLLRPLKLSSSFQAQLPILNRKIDAQEMRSIEVDGPALIIVEGVQLLRKTAVDVFDYKIWIEVPFEEGLSRALNRKGHLGVPMTEEQRKEQYVNWSTAGYELYAQNDRPQEGSNLIIDGLKPVEEG